MTMYTKVMLLTDVEVHTHARAQHVHNITHAHKHTHRHAIHLCAFAHMLAGTCV